MIVKLSNILRRLLGKDDEFVPLSEEIEFVDDYLDIEVVRFGRDKLRVFKELDPNSLDILVPSMILQPLVENAIKHGLSDKVEGGSIFVRSRAVTGKIIIEVEDDGVGMSGLRRASSSSGTGIGMVNVAERLQVVFGDAGQMTRGKPARPGNAGTSRIAGPAGRRHGRLGRRSALRSPLQHLAVDNPRTPE